MTGRDDASICVDFSPRGQLCSCASGSSGGRGREKGQEGGGEGAARAACVRDLNAACSSPARLPPGSRTSGGLKVSFQFSSGFWPESERQPCLRHLLCLPFKAPWPRPPSRRQRPCSISRSPPTSLLNKTAAPRQTGPGPPSPRRRPVRSLRHVPRLPLLCRFTPWVPAAGAGRAPGLCGRGRGHGGRPWKRHPA